MLPSAGCPGGGPCTARVAIWLPLASERLVASTWTDPAAPLPEFELTIDEASRATAVPETETEPARPSLIALLVSEAPLTRSAPEL
jgi:hypothetical protein